MPKDIINLVENIRLLYFSFRDVIIAYSDRLIIKDADVMTMGVYA